MEFNSLNREASTVRGIGDPAAHNRSLPAGCKAPGLRCHEAARAGEPADVGEAPLLKWTHAMIVRDAQPSNPTARGTVIGSCCSGSGGLRTRPVPRRLTSRLIPQIECPALCGRLAAASSPWRPSGCSVIGHSWRAEHQLRQTGPAPRSGALIVTRPATASSTTSDRTRRGTSTMCPKGMKTGGSGG